MSEFVGEFLGPLAQLLGIVEGSAGGVWPTLVAQLENAGLGAHVRSWTNESDKLPVTPEQLSDAFTPQQLQALADEAGTTPDLVLRDLADSLPHAVARAAEAGHLPPTAPV
jgi:uncharacterized protein YidB (DUF937 family)